MNELINKPIHSDWRDILPRVEKDTVSCVITDPPYGMDYKSNNRKEKQDKIAGDSDKVQLAWIYQWARELNRITTEDAHLYIFCSFHKVEVFKKELQRVFRIKNILVWDKVKYSMGDLEGDYAPGYEFILFINKGKPLRGGRQRNIIKFTKPVNSLHPTQKPVELYKYLLSKSTKPGDICLDTFAGSFPMAKACIETGRNYIVTELSGAIFRRCAPTIQGITPDMFAVTEETVIEMKEEREDNTLDEVACVLSKSLSSSKAAPSLRGFYEELIKMIINY